MAEDRGEKIPVNYYKLREDANKAAQLDLFEKWIKSGKDPEVREIAREEWKGVGVPSPDEIVGGEMYPSCIACYEEKTACLWEFRVLRARMQQLNPAESSCERCQVNRVECRFVWGVMDPLKKMEDAMNRLVRHAGSEYRKTDRRVVENEAARNGLVKAITVLREE